MRLITILKFLKHTAAKMQPHQNIKIALTPVEKEIFTELLEFRQHAQLKTVLRVAGGWVRDKVLGLDSHDVDIALDDMKGETFVKLISDYKANKNEKVSGFGVTKFNPEQSKHLETATVKIKDHWIDFVNLRSQKYSQDSRVPIIDIGTPLQDAQRRDLTINSLFYNLITNQVEDWTQTGLRDLRDGVIRTPLDPYLTFKDDPLRILRTFRFAGRFNFKVVPEIFVAASKPQIKQALRTKISKERVGIEVSSMLKGRNPAISIGYLYQNDLWNTVFDVPESSDLVDPKILQRLPETSFRTFQRIAKSYNIAEFPVLSKFLAEKGEEANQSDGNLKLCVLLSALMMPYSPYKYINKKKTEPLAEYMIKESLKLPGKQADFAHRTTQAAHSLYKLLTQSPSLTKLIAVKWLKSINQKWEVSICLLRNAHPEDLKLQQLLKQFCNIIYSEKLGEVFSVQSFIDGNFIRTELGKKGPTIGTILNNSIMWRIMHPDKTKEELIQAIKADVQSFQNPNLYQ